jgi:hypothetical protein
MSVHTPESNRTAAPYAEYVDEEHGKGWVTFAGVLLLLLGTVNFIEGIAAIDKANFFVGNAHYVFGDLNTWGWVALCIGVLQFLVGLGVFVGNQFARWAGVVVLCGSAIAALLMMPAYPFWALTIIALDLLAVYGLVAYGERLGR